MDKFTDWLNETKEEDKVQKYKKKPVTIEAITISQTSLGFNYSFRM